MIFYSCSTQKNEYIEFETYNSIVIGSRTNITLIPTYKNKKKNVQVKILRHNEYFDSRKITNEKYAKIIGLFAHISIKDTAKTIWIDGPTILINFKKGDSTKKFYYNGIPDKDEKLSELTSLILETAKFKIQDIN